MYEIKINSALTFEESLVYNVCLLVIFTSLKKKQNNVIWPNQMHRNASLFPYDYAHFQSYAFNIKI